MEGDIIKRKLIANVLAGIVILSFLIYLFGCQNQKEKISGEVKEISAGPHNSLYLLENGEVYHVGLGLYNKIDNENTEEWLYPVKIRDLSNVKDVSAGDLHNLFLLENGDVYSSGLGGYGNLGHGKDKEPKAPDQIETNKELREWLKDVWKAKDQIKPKKVKNISDVKEISAGGKHSLVLLENGEVYSFGCNNNGQLGHGDSRHRYYPEKIEGLTNAKAISAGIYYSLVLLENGEVYSFGRNDWGQLGLGDYEDRFKPEKIKGLNNVKNISAGFEHSLVILENGEVNSFGNPRNGQLGRKMEYNANNITMEEIIEMPIEEKLTYHEKVGTYFMPAKVEGIENTKDIATGFLHSLILKNNGDVYSFGHGYHGALGHGDWKDQNKPKKIKKLSNVISISSSLFYSIVLEDNGKVYSFGSSEDGQLGHGNYENKYSPKVIDYFN